MKKCFTNSLFNVLRIAIALFCFAVTCSGTHALTAVDDKNDMNQNISNGTNMSRQLLIQLKDGDVVVELYHEKAPQHVARILELVQSGFYDGLKFHRVIDGFMVQTGDPRGDGTGGSDKPDLPAEFNDIKHVRGVVSMARSANPNSANSQFFIMLGDAPHLDGQYTAFGKVTSGMEFVDNIKKGNANRNGAVEEPDSIVSLSIMHQ